MEPTEQDLSREQLRRIHLLDYAVVLAAHKKLILRTVILATLVAVILFYLVIPRWYKSTSVVMPPKQKGSLGLLSSLSRATAPLRGLGLGMGSDDLADLQTILASRRVMEQVITKFGLMEVYGVNTMGKAVEELEDNVEFSLGTEEVSLEITVFDTDASRAAAMSNYFVDMLDKVYLEMNATEARSNREFLERRYKENLADLRKAEESFKAFQEKYGVYSVPDQIKAAVQVAAALESRVALKEVELGILAKTSTVENPERQAAALELRELRRQLDVLKKGSGDGKNSSLVFGPFERAPEIGIEFLRHYRDVEIQGKILELLVPLYEQARIEEQRTTPSVIVLDRAVPAEKASRPKRSLIILGVMALSFLAAYSIALGKESAQRMKADRSDADAAKIDLVKRELNLKRLFR